MKYLHIHSSSSIWLRDDNLWTNLNQFCVNIMELIVFITHIDCMDVSISLNLLVFLLFPRPLLRYNGTFHENPVAIGGLLRIGGVIANWMALNFVAFVVRYLLRFNRIFLLFFRLYTSLHLQCFWMICKSIFFHIF